MCHYGRTKHGGLCDDLFLFCLLPRQTFVLEKADVSAQALGVLYGQTNGNLMVSHCSCHPLYVCFVLTTGSDACWNWEQFVFVLESG